MESRFNKNIEYVFSRDEAAEVCYATGRLKPFRNRSLIQTLVALVAIGVFSVEIVRNPGDFLSYIIVLTGTLLIFSCWVFPRRAEDSYFAEHSMLIKRSVSLDYRAISMSRGNEILLIKPQEVTNYGVLGDIVVISTDDGRFIELPVRAATDEQLMFLDKILNTSHMEQNMI